MMMRSSQQHSAGSKIDTQLQPQHTQWYYTDNNKKTRGPINTLEIYQLFQTNVINKDTFVWNPKIVRIWAPLRSIKELYNLLKIENLDSDSFQKYLDEHLSAMTSLYSSIETKHNNINTANSTHYTSNYANHDYCNKYGHKPQDIMSENDDECIYQKQKSAQTEPNNPYNHLQRISNSSNQRKSTYLSDVSHDHLEQRDFDQSEHIKPINVEKRASLSPSMINNAMNHRMNGNIKIITEEENKAINSLHKRYMKTSKMIQAFECGVELIDNECSKYKEDIHSTFDGLINKLQKRKQFLLSDLDHIKNEKKNILNKQISGLKRHKQQILKAKKEYDDNMQQSDIERRKSKNLRLCMNVLSKHRNNISMNVIPFINVTFKEDEHDQFINTIGFIDDIHKPLPPKLTMKYIDSDYSEIEWTLNDIQCNKANNKRSNKGIDGFVPYKKRIIKEFEIQIAENIKCDISKKEDVRRITVHEYEEYSDEEKEYSTTQHLNDELQTDDKWKTIGIITNELNDYKWSYTIRNLYKDNEYLVRMRCRNNFGYSDYCKYIKFKTLSRKQQEKMEWCLEPYSLDKDDCHLNMNGLRIYENGKNDRIQIYSKQFCKLIVNYNLNRWPYNKYIWCFQLHSISNCSWLGFIENPINKTILSYNNWLGSELYDYSIGINNINRSCFPYSKSKSIGTIQLLHIPKNEDKIYFIIDLIKQNCQIYHNNYNLGIIFENISLDIVPAISNGEDPMDCTVSFRKSL